MSHVPGRPARIGYQMNGMKARSTVPARIILSRKGFDQSSGGFPSPIYPDGSMLSIPIPESPRHQVRIRFEELGIQGTLRIPHTIATSSGGVSLAGPVHLDPDIRPSLRPGFASPHSRTLYLFGQDNASQTHLQNEGVGTGDLF